VNNTGYLNNDISYPTTRFRESLPVGMYQKIGNKYINTAPNQNGYRNESLASVNHELQTSDKIYLDKIGTLMFARQDEKIATYLLTLQKYLDKISADRFFSTQCVLPGSYWVNMFHGLNPQHLNYVHKITQNGIKFIKITDYQNTEYGGIIKFLSNMEQLPALDSLKKNLYRDPLLKHLVKYLDMFRRESFVSELILHGPFSFEMRIPSPAGQYVSFVFTTKPLSDEKCKLYIDFYSNFPIPQSINWFFFHLVTPIVIMEDTVHLKELKSKGVEFFKTIRQPVPDTHFLRLHQRFLELWS
jgi:hypothetical protein